MPPHQHHFDAIRYRQILLNILGNAIKFTSTGSVSLELGVHRQTSDFDLIRVRIRDTGAGMPADQIPYLFGEFTQLDGSSNRRHQGTGLGLAITEKLVNLMQGKIEVSSKIGVGTTFDIYLPIPRSTESPLDEGTGDEAGGELPTNLKILIAEDNAMNQFVAQKILEGLHQRVFIANDGKEALAMCSRERFDVIFMDMQMPNLSGPEATEAIRALESKRNQDRVPILALTANARPEDRQACLTAGMDGFLAKPITRAAIEQALRNLTASVG